MTAPRFQPGAPVFPPPERFYSRDNEAAFRGAVTTQLQQVAQGSETTDWNDVYNNEDVALISELALGSYPIAMLAIDPGFSNRAIYADNGGALAGAALGAANTLFKSQGASSTPVFAKLVDADVDAAAAIDTTKIALQVALTAIGALTPAADRLPYYTGASSGALATFTAFGRSLVDDADASAARTTLGLAIGADVQAYDATLAALAGATTSAGGMLYWTAVDTVANLANPGTAAVLTHNGTIPAWLNALPFAQLSGAPTGTAGNWSTSGLSIAATGYTGQNLGGSVRAVTVANNSSSPPAYQMHYNSDSISAGTEVGGIEQWAGSATPKKICRIAFVNVDTGEDDGTIRFFTAVANVMTDRGEMDNAGKFLWRGELELDGALNHDGTTVGFYGVTPATRPTAYTQTYSTADKTHANFTSADIGAFVGGATGFTDAAERDNIRTQFNALRADVADVKQLINSVIDDLQTLGILQ